jgi:hypothetical protein
LGNCSSSVPNWITKEVTLSDVLLSYISLSEQAKGLEKELKKLKPIVTATVKATGNLVLEEKQGKKSWVLESDKFTFRCTPATRESPDFEAIREACLQLHPELKDIFEMKKVSAEFDVVNYKVLL